jgi:hypothetical protein
MPASAHSGRAAHSGGLYALAISGAQDKAASQPIILIHADGAATRPSRKTPITMPNGMAAISNPTVSVLPCSERTYSAR